MKKLFCLFAAAALILSCGCAKKTDPEASKPSPTPRTVSESTKATVSATENRDYDNSVVFEDGKLVSGNFNWQYFSAKANAKISGWIEIVSREDGGDAAMRLEYLDGKFTLSGSAERSYNYLIEDTVSLAEGELTVAFLTDDPDMTAEALFGGAAPEKVAIGDAGAGFIVYVNGASD